MKDFRERTYYTENDEYKMTIIVHYITVFVKIYLYNKQADKKQHENQSTRMSSLY